ncbi:MAG: Rrf2 family transcriptional regulator [Alphaproteobacteria bacterium PRO2]|nr:Rrf2 family transcriptional regulator [Alphaproteobacteria bacterium PRO2]
MQLTIFTDYGLRSLMFLAAHPDRLCSVREIADHYGISYNHLVKVVHRLSQLEYVQSVKGKGGGVKLAKDSMTLKLGDIVQTLEPNMELVECFNSDTNTCRITNSCQLKHYLFDANRAFIASLNNHTLADTLKNTRAFKGLDALTALTDKNGAAEKD